MPQVLVTDTYLDSIADAIRFKNGTENTYTPAQMAPAIRALSSVPEGYLLPSGTFEITQNGEYDISQYETVRANFQATTITEGHVEEDANGIVTFSPTSGLTYQDKTVTPSSSQQVITADSEYDGLSSVTVNAMTLQSKTATPNDITQTITADSGYAGLSQITVDPVPNTYVSRSQVITYYVDSAEPTASDGSDGDIWLVTGA